MVFGEPSFLMDTQCLRLKSLVAVDCGLAEIVIISLLLIDITSGWTFVTIVVVDNSMVLIHGAIEVGTSVDEALVDEAEVVDGVKASACARDVTNSNSEQITCTGEYMIGY